MDTPNEGIDRVKELEKNQIKVVPVVIGNQVDPIELVKRTNNKQYLVKGKEDEQLAPFGDKIMDKVIKGKLNFNWKRILEKLHYKNTYQIMCIISKTNVF